MQLFTFRYSLLLLLCAVLVGCEGAPPSDQVFQGKTMGTVWRVTASGLTPEQAKQLPRLIQQRLDADDQELSTWKKDSWLTRFNHNPSLEPQPISDNVATIISSALYVGRMTEGAMDITVGPLVNLWGFGPRAIPTHTPSVSQISAARNKVGLQHLTLSDTVSGSTLRKDIPDLYVDLSTVGEGFAADHLARLMEEQGVRNYLVSVGGALISRGQHQQGQPWRVAVQKPTDKFNQAQVIVDLQGHGISTSGDYRNYYELEGKRISHIIDPSTGQPIEHHLVSATVIATTALEADAWDTGLMVLGTEKAKALANKLHLAVYLITKQGDNFVGWASPTFKTFLVNEPEK
ncbi:FAD:protein FMN transferase ApbE [Tatumella ptyseos]|uniref:FAD:protein FMN transferase ApbE n=1 Tax=Tatumella ptyseos TaxID=82987 RepID=UPI0026F0D359|nr:FAD:protein FMN transferase ApbE [Tatumella ptyseos]WKX25505.1 FAD:protein FMN transferase ApbE [Tatumella ptyseos]